MAVHIATWLKSMLLGWMHSTGDKCPGYQQSFVFASLREGICTGVGLQLPAIYVPASCYVCSAKNRSAVDEIMYNRLQNIML